MTKLQTYFLIFYLAISLVLIWSVKNNTLTDILMLIAFVITLAFTIINWKHAKKK